jgi:superfamily II DNA or RNA helicase
VLESWPARWLVADDVGLGKTIEAGLVLWPLLSRGTVNRLLIICPASLVEQWQYRLRTMFDIRLARYVSEADTEKADFWHTHPQIVASLQTLRKDSRSRHDRMLGAPPWDLLVVDEAHHLNADEQGGPTLGYKLVDQLVQGNKVASMVFFTGTPHRGKDFGFLSLLKLLRPDLFDPRRPFVAQLQDLRKVMIRNNKQNVTDLKGQRLFHPPIVESETYSYTDAESYFYDMLTDFIATGKAYASTLSSSDQRTAILVLISMQKLASSSVAAIRRALKNRLARIQTAQERLGRLESRKKVISRYEELEDVNDSDALAEIEEQIAILTAELRLMRDEEPRLVELIKAADAVTNETKIEKIRNILETRFPDRAVLFFTEYKATQSLLMSALIGKYGDGCVTFINGDGRAEEVVDASGTTRSIVEERETAAFKFNTGKVRFLVSTEAAGEGIDLQQNAHTLIHVDLPWNPMRLHQRVGRLNRYGQSKQVEVMTLRNPSTVESRIWAKLNTKIGSIMQALQEVMEEPEDLLELVLGMTSPQMFREVFSEAPDVPEESLSKWFDEKTARFGGQDVLDTVRGLIGHCAAFDFQEVSDKIPKLDLPDLQAFFLSMLAINNRRIDQAEDGIGFRTPEKWLMTPAVKTSYRGLVFMRSEEPSVSSDRILGVGHVLVDQAIRQARSSTASVATIPRAALSDPLFVFRITDKVTSNALTVRSVVAAVEVRGTQVEVIPDWKLLVRLNELLEKRTLRRDVASARPDDSERAFEQAGLAQEALHDKLESLDLPFQVPEIQLLAVLWPITQEK